MISHKESEAGRIATTQVLRDLADKIEAGESPSYALATDWNGSAAMAFHIDGDPYTLLGKLHHVGVQITRVIEETGAIAAAPRH